MKEGEMANMMGTEEMEPAPQPQTCNVLEVQTMTLEQEGLRQGELLTFACLDSQLSLSL